MVCFDSGLDDIYAMPNICHATLGEDATTPNIITDQTLIDCITLETSHISSD